MEGQPAKLGSQALFLQRMEPRGIITMAAS